MKLLTYVADVKLKKVEGSDLTNVGTFYKPLALVLRKMYKMMGYKVILRGRGKRAARAPQLTISKADHAALYISK